MRAYLVVGGAGIDKSSLGRRREQMDDEEEECLRNTTIMYSMLADVDWKGRVQARFVKEDPSALTPLYTHRMSARLDLEKPDRARYIYPLTTKNVSS